AGNWGGVLRNPATVLANAAASLVDGRGVIRVPGMRPRNVSERVRALVRDFAVGSDDGDPVLDAQWGEPGLSAGERLFA
ncbi:hypothetical protein ABTE28_20775, partial [Acinetobacter baumannii]